ncbi:CobN-like chelatase BtuS for metalloporphyrine salvage [Methanosarcina siciliae C2J]|uniref:CobN-like chelatase BtuS for metalloporphyrine salvage n=2 Tax=Methanosarcina siciliae TaxID=38027 RepID=A0A0E3LC57_9EURY|nr:CobN-like chelatase BtuS for metalloporphyrine salvage [Methanosarcina siciliae C2J]
MLGTRYISIQKNFCIKFLTSVLLLMLLSSLISTASAAENTFSFVLGAENNTEAFEAVLAEGDPGVTINLYNATEANSTDFSSEKVLFLASLDEEALANINSTLNQSAHIVSYDLPEGFDLGNSNDPNMTELWEAGGYHNIKTLIRYMNDTFYGGGVQAPEKLEVAFVFSRESAVLTMDKVALDPELSGVINISTYFGRSNEDLSFDLSDKDIIIMRNLDAQVIEAISPTVNQAKANGAYIISLGDLIQSYNLHNVNLSDPNYADITEYFTYDSEENFKRLATFVGVKFADRYDVIEEPVSRPLYGLYHPDAPEVYSSAGDYLDWYINRGDDGHVYDPAMPTVGIISDSFTYIDTRDAPLVEALVDSFESSGCNVVVATYSYKDEGSRDYLMLNGSCIADSVVIISRGSRFNYADSEQGIEDLKTWNVIPLNGIRLFYDVSAEEWENSSHGVGPEQTYQLSAAEMDGIIEPIVIGCKDPSIGDSVYYPIDYQVEWLVNRTISWTELHRKTNSEKKIVIPYYAAEAGKAEIGADIDYYLDAQASLANILVAMKERGYNLGNDSLPDRDELAEIMTERGHNVGVWAPGVLDSLVENGDVILIPEARYLEWFDALPEEKQAEMEDIWGPAPGEIMVWKNETGKYLVIPKLEYGNVLLAPDPMWGWDQDESVTYYDGSIPPTHQCLAFYKYMGEEYGADALFTIFSSVEMMPGKESGLSAKDWGAILLQDMPMVHVLPMDAEGIFDRRRANMLVVDFLTPTIVPSGLYGNLTLLQQDISLFEQAADPAVKAEYRELILNSTRDLDLDTDLGVDLESIAGNETKTDAFIEDLDAYLGELKTIYMPYGSHTLSEPPTGESLVAMVEAMLGDDFKARVEEVNSTEGLTTALLNETVLSGKTAEEAQNLVLGTTSENVSSDLELALEYTERINACTIEIPRVLDALEGKYIPPGPAGDPIRNPDALPTGRNLCTFDDRLVPTKAAWNVGVKLGDELLEELFAENGAYPEKVSFLLWSIETSRNQGTMESEIFYLLGVKPVRDSKGRVKDVELIDSDELGRPRIDVLVTTSGSYRDMYASRLQLIDRAVKLAANASDNETYLNYVKQNSEKIEEALLAAGYDQETAENLSTSRIFCPSPGSYTPGIENAISGADWEDREDIADLYIDRMGYVYGENIWGEQYTDVFRENLADVEVGVFSRTSNVYGVLEHPMVAAYFGGLSMAVESVRGSSPDMYINNLRSSGEEGVETLQHFLSRDLRSRYMNPTWIEGMMQDGYDGTRYMNAFVENMRVWEVATPDLVTEDMWNEVYKTYFRDQYDLGVTEHLKNTNPYAYQSIALNLLESVRRGDWNPPDEVLEELAREYAESVVEDGVTCCHHTCGNPTLNSYVAGLVSVPGFTEAIEEATQESLEQEVSEKHSSSGNKGSSTPVIRSSESSNQTVMEEDTGYGVDSPEPAPEVSGSSADPDYVEGYEMTQETVENEDGGGMSFSGADILGTLFVLVAAGGIYLGIRKKKF